MENKPNILELFPYWITGDSYRILAGYDAYSRKKIAQLGWFVLIPTFLWFITGYLVQSALLGGSVLLSFITGLICAFIIFLIERSIVIARRSHWFLVITRVVLGMVVAGLGSFVIDLVLFKTDIDKSAIQIYRKETQSRRDSVAQLELMWTDSLNREMAGRGGSKQRGFGYISQELKSQVLGAKQLGKSMDSIRISEERSIFNSTDSGHALMIEKLALNTIAHRTVLLHQLIKKDRFTLIVWIALFVLGLLIETIPFVTKLLTPQSAYELDLDTVEVLLENRRKLVLQKSQFYSSQSREQQLINDILSKESYYPFRGSNKTP